MSVRVETIGDVNYLLGASAISGAKQDGVGRALEAGAASLRELQEEISPDLDLIFGGSLDVLPRSAVARVAMEAARTAAYAGHGEHSVEAARYALVGACADQALAAMKDTADLGAAYVVSGEVGAFSIQPDALLEVPPDCHGALWLEVVRGLRPGFVKGGIAVAGARVPRSADGDADAVALYARSATEASLSAVLVADAVTMSPVAKAATIPPAEEIWNALSKGVRVLLPLREANMVRAAILSLRGRGRLIGPVAGDRLLRFGVSDWR